jgi:hypothetical protein
MTTVSVYSYTHSVTYVADNILKSIKDIIRLSGLNPAKFVHDWDVNMRGIKAWLESRHLQKIVLEVYHPKTNALIVRWDVNIAYAWSDSDGAFWTDTEQIKYSIRKAGVVPSEALYDLIAETAVGRPDVSGWHPTQYRSTSGMVRQSLGTTIRHGTLGASVSYLRKP